MTSLTQWSMVSIVFLVGLAFLLGNMGGADVMVDEDSDFEYNESDFLFTPDISSFGFTDIDLEDDADTIDNVVFVNSSEVDDPFVDPDTFDQAMKLEDGASSGSIYYSVDATGFRIVSDADGFFSDNGISITIDPQGETYSLSRTSRLFLDEAERLDGFRIDFEDPDEYVYTIEVSNGYQSGFISTFRSWANEAFNLISNYIEMILNLPSSIRFIIGGVMIGVFTLVTLSIFSFFSG